MLIWISALIFVALLGAVLSLIRLRIPRDAGKEGGNDYESTMAYDQVSRGLIFIFFRFLMMRRLNKFRPQGILVDAGCGPGYLATAIASKYPHLQIIGIDLSPQMIDLAEDKLSGNNIKRQVTFQRADVCDLPFENNSANFVISTLSLHHWTKPGEALQEIYRVLKPDGQMLLFDIRRDESLLVYYTGHMIQRFFISSHIRRVNGAIGSIWSSYTPDEMKTLISKSPFSHWEVQAGWAWAYIMGQKSTIRV